MAINEILMHQTPSRARIYARSHQGSYDLQAITTLGSDALHLAKDLVERLEGYLSSRDVASLDEVLVKVPEAVAQSVRRFASSLPPLELGDTDDEVGLIEDVRCFWVMPRSAELTRFMEAASDLSMGVRIDNETGGRETLWKIVIRSEEPMLNYAAEPRAWSLPEGLTLESTWSNAKYGGDIDEAADVADDANAEGKYVRMHSYLQWKSPDPDDSAVTVGYVVDVFDAPIPDRPD